MVVEIKGNLLTDAADMGITHICHQVNCQGAMNSGIAKSIREKYPEVYNNYYSLVRSVKVCNPDPDNFDKFLLGNTQIVFCEDVAVINMFSQSNYGYDGKRYTSYDAFAECLENIKEKLHADKVKIGFPKGIGCCRGGAEWPIIKKMIETILDGYIVYIFELEDN